VALVESGVESSGRREAAGTVGKNITSEATR
jgi:hypothetical protein